MHAIYVIIGLLSCCCHLAVILMSFIVLFLMKVNSAHPKGRAESSLSARSSDALRLAERRQSDGVRKSQAI